MKLYIASAFQKRFELRKKVLELRRLGFDVQSDWIWLSCPELYPDTVGDHRDVLIPKAQLDFKQIGEADAFVLDVGDRSLPYRNSLIEFGIALGSYAGGFMDLGLIVVIQGSNRPFLFSYLPQIKTVKDWDECINYLNKVREGFLE